VETIAKIRRYYFVEGRSIKKISRNLNISRNTVRKVIRSGKSKHEYSRKKQVHPDKHCNEMGLDTKLLILRLIRVELDTGESEILIT